MKGSFDIRVSNKTLSYHFTVQRNITIIQGNSATGKTTLVSMIREHELQGEDSAVSVSCRCPCTVIEGMGWKRQLSLIEDSIIFIDEGNRFVASREFAEVVSGSSNYYVIVTREPLYELPYSVEEIYGIRSTGKYGTLAPVYHEMYHLYSSVQEVGTAEKCKNLITEDGNAGFQFFNKALGEHLSCVSANGNAGIYALLEETSSTDAALVIADGAAFGPFMSKIAAFMKHHSNIMLYLPESFEWIILSSGIIDGNRVKDVLDHPSDFIDSREYFSWERFFTAMLIKETKGTYLQYQKAKLNDVYLHDRQKKAILEQVPEKVRKLITGD